LGFEVIAAVNMDMTFLTLGARVFEDSRKGIGVTEIFKYIMKMVAAGSFEILMPFYPSSYQATRFRLEVCSMNVAVSFQNVDTSNSIRH
jgi:hypothetical protein